MMLTTSPTEHQGIAHPDSWTLGATCDPCKFLLAEIRQDKFRGSPMVGIVPGGSKDTTQIKFSRNFDRGLDMYRAAKDEGIQPDHSTVEGVHHAHARIKSQEEALRKIKNFSDIDGVKTAPGVNRDVR